MFKARKTSVISLAAVTLVLSFLVPVHAAPLSEQSQEISQVTTVTNEPDALLKKASAQQLLGQHYKAIATLRKAMGYFKNIADNKNISIILSSLGYSYTQTGQFDRAHSTLDKCIKITCNSYPGIMASAYNNLGLLYEVQASHDKAVHAFEEALRFTVQDIARIKISSNIVRIKAESKKYSIKHDDIENIVLQIDKLEPSATKANFYINIGTTANLLYQHSSQNEVFWKNLALNLMRKAHELGEKMDNKITSSYATGYQGQILYENGDLDKSIILTNKAIFYAQAAESPESLYLWQWQHAKLLNHLKNPDQAIISYRNAIDTLQSIRNDINLTVQARQKSFRTTAENIYFELADLLLQRASRKNDIALKQNDLKEARHRIEQLKTVELVNYFGNECVAELKERTVELDKIGNNTAIFYPVLLDNRLELLLTLPSGIHQITVPVSKDIVINETRLFREKLEKRTTRQYLHHAQKLYQLLIEPVYNKLNKNNIKTLVIVPDSALRTIPLGALHDGKEYLIEKFSISYTPSLYVTDARSLPRENMQILASGLTESVQGFPALPNVGAEIESINKIYNSKILKDRDFSESNIRTAITEKPFTIVHFATHGQFNSNPDETFLLTYDNKIKMNQLRSLMGISNYREKPVELLTLSACQTAAGDDKAALGLAGIAISAGARSALATLWFVNDEATSKLVSDFYTHLANPDISKADALRLAQIELIKERRYRHAAYWAPFLLIGNWL